MDQAILPITAWELSRSAGSLVGASEVARYRSFFVRDRQLAPPAKALGGKYPRLFAALNGLSLSVCRQAVLAIERLAQDIEIIRDVLGVGHGALARMRASGSDRHTNGGQVYFFDFDDGTVVYKPTDLGVDKAVKSLVGALALPEDLRVEVVPCLPRGSYGWAEFIPFAPQSSGEQTSRYWRRAGALLAVADGFNFTDGHFENLVATDGQPVIVDNETWFQSFDDDLGPVEDHSVLFTGLVQRKSDEANGRGLMAAYQVTGSDMTHYLHTHAINESTDRLEVRFRGSFRRPTLNTPVYQSQYAASTSHIDELVDGMLRTYQHLIRRRGKLFETPEWRRLESIRVRQLLRATLYYLLQIRWLEQPQNAHDLDIARGFLLEQLRPEPGSTSAANPYMSEVVAYEVDALLRFDIPVFYSRPGSRCLWTGDGKELPDFLGVSAMERIRARVESFDARYAWHQVDIVEHHLDVGQRDQAVPEDLLQAMTSGGSVL